MTSAPITYLFFFFNDTATTEIYTLSLHDALPISGAAGRGEGVGAIAVGEGHVFHPDIAGGGGDPGAAADRQRSEEHTSELQSHLNLVCRLLLEKKKRSACRPDARRRCR